MKVLKWVALSAILIGFLIYKFYYYDPVYGCQITIIPSFLPSNNDTKTILKMIREGSPDDYLRICEYVRVINKNPSCGGLDGGCYKPSKPYTIYIGNDQRNIAMAAYTIIHETCHALQVQDGRNLSETECYKIGASYLRAVTLY